MKSLAAAPIITLTTDFGLSDTYVGVMKGVILGIAPNARLIDLTHDIAPQNLLEAGARLEAAIDYFPPGTLHLVVVDPGVGSDRAALVVETAKSRFIAPDNGVLTLPLRHQRPLQAVKLGEAARSYCRQPISATFHGRDIFAPVAAHLASGLPLSALGAPCPLEALVSLAVPEPQAEPAASGSILHIPILFADRFGNLITALTRKEYEAWRETAGAAEEAEFAASLEVQAGGWKWQGIVSTFAEVEEGWPLAYWGSGGRLEIAVRNGSALREMGLAPRDTIHLRSRRTTGE